MFRKFTETLTGTLDTVKSYGSSVVIGQIGQGGAAGADNTDGRQAPSKPLLNLPTLGNGTVSAPATTANSPDRAGAKPSLASNTLLGIQNTLGKLTGRGESTNAAVVASHKQSRAGGGPALGTAVETNVSRITERHDIDDDLKGLGLEDISSFEKYQRLKNAGRLAGDEEDYTSPAPERMNGTAHKLVRSGTDEILDERFKALQGNLDDVLGQTEELDELTPVIGGKDEKQDDSKPKKKKKKNKVLMKCIRCIQDNRVKGGCVDPEEMIEAAGEHDVLKKVLNIVFLTIGTLLFVSVFVVIIYTSFADKNKVYTTPSPPTTTFNPNTTNFAYEYTVPELEELDGFNTTGLSNNTIGWVERVLTLLEVASAP